MHMFCDARSMAALFQLFRPAATGDRAPFNAPRAPADEALPVRTLGPEAPVAPPLAQADEVRT